MTMRIPLPFTSIVVLLSFMDSGNAAGSNNQCPVLPCNSCACGKRKICGEFLRNGNGDVLLPSSGENSCIRCEWEISVPPNCKIRLIFVNFHLGPGDWIKIYDGPTKSSSLITKLDSSCRSGPLCMMSSGRNMLIVFQSDLCGEASRLSATYRVVCGDCGGLIRLNPWNKNSAVIKSPGFPKFYPNNADCLWTVVSTETLMAARITLNYVITVRNKDHIKIYNSMCTNSAIFTYSGTRSLIQLQIDNSPGLTIHFKSDNSGRRKGFKITIQVTATGTSYEIKCRSSLKWAVFLASMCPKQNNELANGRIVLFNHTRRRHFYCCSGYRLKGTAHDTCVDGSWSHRSLPECIAITSCPSPDPPENSLIEGGKKPTALGSVVKFRCKLGFKFAGTSVESITATCKCSGQWLYKPVVPRCEAMIKNCGDPPPAPKPGGKRNISSPSPYKPGTDVNYSCPEGSGMDGIPYRTCSPYGHWEPFTTHHSCIKNSHACDDPGTPGNGTRRILSFLDGSLAYYGCKMGYRTEGNKLRICYASNPNNTYWSGQPVTCVDLFKSADELAAQWRENFIDRTIQCVDEANNSIASATDLKTQNTTLSAGTPKGICRGRSITVGEGCLNLIFAVDCSKSITKTGFQNSLEFVGSSVYLFDIDRGQASVALFTYDHEVYTQFRLGEISTTNATIKAIASAKFCKGSTATRPVLEKIENEIKKRRNESCTTAVFILTDGNNNWAGDPIDVANRIKEIPDVEIYTIAFGTNNLNWDVLRKLASGKDHFITVRSPGDITRAIEKAYDIEIDYASQCGTTSAPDCRLRVIGGCRSKIGAWPWTVGVYVNNGNGFNFQCGGTLAGDCWVLTAAHCVDGLTARNVVVVVGDTVRYIKELTETTHDVQLIIIHPQFDSTSFDYDIALLKLACTVQYKSQVRKICLPRSGDEQYYAPLTQCIVAGWGHTKVAPAGTILNRQLSTALQHVSLPVQDIEHCRSSTSFQVAKRLICAGSGESDSCGGDSGGPLFCKRTGSPGVPTYVIIGIVSWGDGCGVKGQYGYYTNVKMLMGWINTQMVTNGRCLHSLDTCPPPKIKLW